MAVVQVAIGTGWKCSACGASGWADQVRGDEKVHADLYAAETQAGEHWMQNHMTTADLNEQGTPGAFARVTHVGLTHGYELVGS